MLRSERYKVDTTRVSLDHEGNPKVTIMVDVEGKAKLFGKETEVKDRRGIRCDTRNKKMDQEIVKAFWDEVERVTREELNR